jgi:hypothetical protein
VDEAFSKTRTGLLAPPRSSSVNSTATSRERAPRRHRQRPTTWHAARWIGLAACLALLVGVSVGVASRIFLAIFFH